MSGGVRGSPSESAGSGEGGGGKFSGSESKPAEAFGEGGGGRLAAEAVHSAPWWRSASGAGPAALSQEPAGLAEGPDVTLHEEPAGLAEGPDVTLHEEPAG